MPVQEYSRKFRKQNGMSRPASIRWLSTVKFTVGRTPVVMLKLLRMNAGTKLSRFRIVLVFRQKEIEYRTKVRMITMRLTT